MRLVILLDTHNAERQINIDAISEVVVHAKGGDLTVLYFTGLTISHGTQFRITPEELQQINKHHDGASLFLSKAVVERRDEIAKAALAK